MNIEHLSNRASALARMWATAATGGRERRAAQQLANLVADPAGLDFAVEFVDRVARPEDPAAAARALDSLDIRNASFLGALDRGLLGTGRALAPYLPKLVVPAARSRLWALVGHLIVDADEESLTRHIASMLATGYRLNLNLLGEAVLGEREARSRTNRTIALLQRPDVDYVSVKVSSLVSQINPWDLTEGSNRVIERLRPIFAQAMASSPHKFVNLDMEEYRDLALTVEVFEQLLSEPEFMHLSAGIVLQAYLPDSAEAMRRLIEFATRRVQAGGAPIKIRLVKGANLAMEKVEAELHGWAQAPYEHKADVDANFLRLIDIALRPEAAYAVRLGVASHNLFHLAYAHLLAVDRGVEAALDVEMLHGMAPGAAAAIQAEVANPVVLYTPVVAKEDFDVAVSYLVRRLEEAAAEENYLRDHFTGNLERQERAFLAACGREVSTTPRRAHARTPVQEGFANTPNCDPALARARADVAEALAAPLPELQIRKIGAGDVEGVVEEAQAASQEWRNVPAAQRAEVLRSVAAELEKRRFDLISVMAQEAGKTVGEADPEISEAIDFACYYAHEAVRLEQLAAEEGTQFVPDRVVLVTPPWNFPVAIPMGGVLAALAAGSAAIMKPAGQSRLCAQVAMEAVHEGLRAHGYSETIAQIVAVDEDEAGRTLIAHPAVDTVILTGAYATAQLFTSWRVNRERGPRVLAETSGKNALIITPSADFDLAVKDAVQSAFGHAGQKCSAASLVILVGSVAESERFRRQLIDAVESLNVDWPTNLAATVGPIIAPADGKLQRALTTLDDGEQWLVAPQQLDDAGRLWRPGVKVGVQPGSEYHQSEYFGPILGIMAAESLEQAIEWQNSTPFGLTGGIHSLDPAEIEQWREAVEVGNAYVNRTITGAIVRRQPFGGWKNSSVGPGAKAGGPNYVAQLGRWQQVNPPNQLGDIGPRVGEFLDATAPWLPPEERDWLRESARSDAHARDVYRTPVDVSGLRSETNVFRYRPGPRMTIRAGENTPLVQVLRLSAAALAAGVDAGVSVPPSLFAALPEDVRRAWQYPSARGEEEPVAETADPAPAANPGPAGVSEQPAPHGEPVGGGGADTEVIPAVVGAETQSAASTDLATDRPPAAGPRPAPEGVPSGIELSAAPAGAVAGWQVETLAEFTMRAATWVQPGRIRCLDPAEAPAIAESVGTSIAVLPGPALQSGRRELLCFLREQAISQTEHRFGQLSNPAPPQEPGEGAAPGRA